MTTDTTSAEPEAPGGAFAKPAPRTPAQTLAWREAERREDDPPPEVPRDQWERPLIVVPDGSGVIAYTRASKYGKLIRDQRKLIKWDERNIVWGMSRGTHLVARASGVRTLTARPDITVLEDIAEHAKTIAGAHAGAMTGSGMHALYSRRAAGEDLSWLDPTLAHCLDAITDLLDPRIFEVLVTEGDDDLGRTFVIHDELRGAGSFDLVVRLLVDLTWPDGVTVPRGTILVVDLKTGKITSAPYWSTEFSCQQLIYADGVPYRPGTTHLADPKVRSAKNVIKVTGQPGAHGRITWGEIGIPGGPDHRYSLILHVPVQSPADAHWERVDLDEARADADVARRAHERARVDRYGRFLALPAAALLVPGVELPATAELRDYCAHSGPACAACNPDGDPRRPPGPEPVDTAGSTPETPSLGQDQLPGENEGLRPASENGDHFNPTLHAALKVRITRAVATETVDGIYDAWGASPSWTAELTAACQETYDRLAPGEPEMSECEDCQRDAHRCPACGTGVPHGVIACRPCDLRVDLETAPDRATINVLWIAHGPDGDGLWTDEHQAAGITRYRALPATEGWPDLDEGDPDETPETGGGEIPATVPGQPERGAQVYPASAEVFQGPDGDPAGPPETATEPGPFDQTMDLSDLRDLIEQALDTDTLDALYDTHGPVEQGGDGLWTDDLNPVAQAAYDRITAGTGAAS